ncbi:MULTISPECIES: DUF4834 family protein [Pedobacter]|uniref:DUF4834 family protein n=1 Tax=Pedobacter TaxID=84567 RepID=UPI00210A00BE|nr:MULTISPECIES: DUF4834 family protein [unclassified Pedobacter]
MGLIKFILITVLILYIIRIIIRLIFPMVLKGLFSKMQQQPGQQAYNRQRPEGDISIDYMPPSAKTGKTDKLGDFVDYEEIK